MLVWSFADYMLLIMGCGAGTLSFRLFPFLFAKYLKNRPIFTFLNLMLPAAIMIILALSESLRADWSHFPYGLRELIAGAVTLLVHHLFRNSFLSIVCGAGCYMFLLAFLTRL